jgi:hypothetical protein
VPLLKSSPISITSFFCIWKVGALSGSLLAIVAAPEPTAKLQSVAEQRVALRGLSWDAYQRIGLPHPFASRAATLR